MPDGSEAWRPAHASSSPVKVLLSLSRPSTRSPVKKKRCGRSESAAMSAKVRRSCGKLAEDGLAAGSQSPLLSRLHPTNTNELASASEPLVVDPPEPVVEGSVVVVVVVP